MTFNADTASYDIIEGAHIVGFAVGDGTDEYLMFQRSHESDPDDWGVYVELNDQDNSGYGLIRECRISRNSVEIDLKEPLAGENAIRVFLAVDDSAFSTLAEGMRNIFRNHHNLLKIKS